MSRRYTDFELWVYPDPHQQGFRVRAIFAGKVEERWIERLVEEEDLTALRNAAASGRSRDVKIRQTAPVSPRGLGRRLFEAVFGGAVRDLLNDALPGFASRRGLRLRLRLSGEAARWPWELLHSPRKFLALSERTPVVRHLEREQPRPTLWVPYPLRVLVVIASPRGYPTLDGEQELKEIKEALGWTIRLGMVKVERLDPPTLEALEDRLDRGRFHVLHFIGHGSFESQGGCLHFEDSDRNLDPVGGARLAEVVQHPWLRLVVLNACEGARAAEALFSGVAQSIASRGIPAVVAMQFPISDPMAVRFTRRFYRALARRRVVDWAMAKARRAMHAAGGVAWAVPVLFLSSRDGRLFWWRPSWGLVGALLVVGGLLTSYRAWLVRLAPMEGKPPELSAPVADHCPSAESIGMKFVRVPPGTFTMGSGEKNEGPLREVTISEPYCLGAHEVTQGEWEAVLGPNRVNSKRRRPDLPVTSVTWEEMQEFIRKLRGLEGGTIYRLPTEAEWEHGAQGPGGAVNCLHDLFDGLAPVGFLIPNTLGLRGMIGNAWELVDEWYQEPPGKESTGKPEKPRRVRRGGGFDSAPENCRATTRSSQDPSRRANDVGFRLVREIKPLGR